jgi:predicted dehydrogenase
MDHPAKTRVAVIGAGAFGRNHARVYRDLAQAGEVEFTGIVDTDGARAQAVAHEFGTRAFAGVAELLAAASPTAASVAVPTVEHLAVARELMQAGVDVLIEKPLAASVAEADALVELAARHGRVVQVGHLERFNPAVRATLPLVTQPMFFEVHRLSVFTPRSLDVDVVLDLMIHDLDIVLALVKSPVKEIRAVGLPILSEKVDIANVRMEFESGCVANFTASRVSTEKVRKLRFFQPHQYISVDYTRQDVLVFNVDSAPAPAPGAMQEIFLSEAAATPTPGISVSRPQVHAEEPLKAELRAFLEAVRKRTTPLVSLEDGRRALAVAHQVLIQIDDHARRLDLSGMSPRART